EAVLRDGVAGCNLPAKPRSEARRARADRVQVGGGDHEQRDAGDPSVGQPLTDLAHARERARLDVVERDSDDVAHARPTNRPTSASSADSAASQLWRSAIPAAATGSSGRLRARLIARMRSIASPARKVSASLPTSVADGVLLAVTTGVPHAAASS